MTPDNQAVNLTDLADGTLAGPEWDTWLAAHPDAAAEIAVARRVRALMRDLAAAAIRAGWLRGSLDGAATPGSHAARIARSGLL